MAIDIKGQVALVTGASRGIGAAIAEKLAGAGVNVALTARSEDDLNAVAQRCSAQGVKAVAIPADIAAAETAAAVVDRVVEELGGLNILVNNAGVFHAGPVDKLDPDGIDAMVDVNLRAVMHLTRWAIPHIIAGAEGGLGRGALINISSMMGKGTSPRAMGYCATKHAITGLSGSVFDEVGEKGIKVCTIYPSFIATDMVKPFGLDPAMMIQPAELADLVHMVAAWPDTSCPTEIVLNVQRYPQPLEK